MKHLVLSCRPENMDRARTLISWILVPCCSELRMRIYLSFLSRENSAMDNSLLDGSPSHQSSAATNHQPAHHFSCHQRYSALNPAQLCPRVHVRINPGLSRCKSGPCERAAPSRLRRAGGPPSFGSSAPIFFRALLVGWWLVRQRQSWVISLPGRSDGREANSPGRPVGQRAWRRRDGAI